MLWRLGSKSDYYHKWKSWKYMAFWTFTYWVIVKTFALHNTTSFWVRSNFLIAAKYATNQYEKSFFFVTTPGSILQLSQLQNWRNWVVLHLNTFHIVLVYCPVTSIFLDQWKKFCETKNSTIICAQICCWHNPFLFVTIG